MQLASAKIKHVVVIMQENRSFDNYFGTYPGADGIPTDASDSSQFAASDCSPDNYVTHKCIMPYHNPKDGSVAGNHDDDATLIDVNNGKMNGYVDSQRISYQHADCPTDPAKCVPSTDAMGYHDAREIPNYWKYAQNYVLADHEFESTPSWSLPSHLYMLSGWSGACGKAVDNPTWDPSHCTYNYGRPSGEIPMIRCYDQKTTVCPVFAWTPETKILDDHDKTWGYFSGPGGPADCSDAGYSDTSAECKAAADDTAHTPNIWNPLPFFYDPINDPTVGGRVQNSSNFFTKAHAGTLPAVSWVTPTTDNSEHSNQAGGHGSHAGQAWVTSLINSVMNGPDWDSTAIFVSWDDWGGFYDHVQPPYLYAANAQRRFGLRTPMLVISPYAKTGAILHQQIGIDSINKFIEDVFAGSERLTPGMTTQHGFPDPRSIVSETRLRGSLINAFNFNQAPRSPMVLPPKPLPGPASCTKDVAASCAPAAVDDFYQASYQSTGPTSLQTGARDIEVTVHGYGFQRGATASLDSYKPRFNFTVPVTYVDSHTVKLTVSLSRTGFLDDYSLLLTNPDGSQANCNGCLTVKQGPTISDVSPATVADGDSRRITLTGTKFFPGARVTSSGGLRFTNTQVVDATTITTTATPDAGSPAGNRALTVTNVAGAGSGSGACTDCFTVTSR